MGESTQRLRTIKKPKGGGTGKKAVEDMPPPGKSERLSNIGR